MVGPNKSATAPSHLRAANWCASVPGRCLRQTRRQPCCPGCYHPCLARQLRCRRCCCRCRLSQPPAGQPQQASRAGRGGSAARAGGRPAGTGAPERAWPADQWLTGGVAHCENASGAAQRSWGRHKPRSACSGCSATGEGAEKRQKKARRASRSLHSRSHSVPLASRTPHPRGSNQLPWQQPTSSSAASSTPAAGPSSCPATAGRPAAHICQCTKQAPCSGCRSGLPSSPPKLRSSAAAS